MKEKYTSRSVIYILYNKYISCILKNMRYTIKEFNQQFPDDDACLDSLFEMRYGDVKDCPRCAVVDTKFYRVKGRKCYACMHCGYQLHPLAQTIFHKSSTPLTSWFYVMFKFGNSKNGVAALEVQRDLGVTYKTALRMCHQVRKLMEQDDEPLGGSGGVVEIDETYIGGRRKLSQKYLNKQVVFGAVERYGRARVKHVKSSGARALLPEIATMVEPGANIYTDEYRAYITLARRGYTHTTVNHSKLEYVRGHVSTNTAEGLWSQIKRSIDGTYHAVSPKYLQNYLNEFAFRYSLRSVAVYPVLLERAALPCEVKP
jgi:transposase-like protein